MLAEFGEERRSIVKLAPGAGACSPGDSGGRRRQLLRALRASTGFAALRAAYTNVGGRARCAAPITMGCPEFFLYRERSRWRVIYEKPMR